MKINVENGYYMNESKLEIPVADKIKTALRGCPSGLRKRLLNQKTQNEFIEDRVTLFLQELDKAFQDGFDPIEAERQALAACTKDLKI